MTKAIRVFVDSIVKIYNGMATCPHCMKYNEFSMGSEYSVYRCSYCGKNFVIEINSDCYGMSGNEG